MGKCLRVLFVCDRHFLLLRVLFARDSFVVGEHDLRRQRGASREFYGPVVLKRFYRDTGRLHDEGLFLRQKFRKLMLYRDLNNALGYCILAVYLDDAFKRGITRTKAVNFCSFLKFFEHFFPIPHKSFRGNFCTDLEFPRTLVARDFYVREGVNHRASLHHPVCCVELSPGMKGSSSMEFLLFKYAPQKYKAPSTTRMRITMMPTVGPTPDCRSRGASMWLGADVGGGAGCWLGG